MHHVVPSSLMSIAPINSRRPAAIRRGRAQIHFCASAAHPMLPVLTDTSDDMPRSAPSNPAGYLANETSKSSRRVRRHMLDGSVLSDTFSAVHAWSSQIPMLTRKSAENFGKKSRSSLGSPPGGKPQLPLRVRHRTLGPLVAFSVRQLEIGRARCRTVCSPHFAKVLYELQLFQIVLQCAPESSSCGETEIKPCVTIMQSTKVVATPLLCRCAAQGGCAGT